VYIRGLTSSPNLYEGRPYLNEYLLFHYGKPKDICPFPFALKGALNFHRRIIQECLQPLRSPQPTRGLDAGCAVGRSTFELAQKVDWALGIDNSKQFIHAAQRMARVKSLPVCIKTEGDLHSIGRVTLPKTLRGGRVKFMVGDAQDLSRFMDHPFHVVLAINLIDRLPNPLKFLAQLPSLIVPCGQLILGSPYTWLNEYTPSSQWLGGRRVKSGARFTHQTLLEVLNPDFRLISRRDLPFLIREHRRKYQWVVSEILVFRRKSAKCFRSS